MVIYNHGDFPQVCDSSVLAVNALRLLTQGARISQKQYGKWTRSAKFWKQVRNHLSDISESGLHVPIKVDRNVDSLNQFLEVLQIASGDVTIRKPVVQRNQQVHELIDELPLSYYQRVVSYYKSRIPYWLLMDANGVPWLSELPDSYQTTLSYVVYRPSVEINSEDDGSLVAPSFPQIPHHFIKAAKKVSRRKRRLRKHNLRTAVISTRMTSVHYHHPDGHWRASLAVAILEIRALQLGKYTPQAYSGRPPDCLHCMVDNYTRD